MANAKRKAKPEPAGPLKLDLGCGKNPREGFIGVDSRPFGQQIVLDLVKRRKGVEQYHTLGAPESDGYDLFEKWPWEDNSVDEVHCSHFYEHLTQKGRAFFLNELHRVLKPVQHENGTHVRGFATVILPHWDSGRAYGDLSHEWPPAGVEFHMYYMNKKWRDGNAPHNDFLKCDFDILGGHHWDESKFVGRSQDFRDFAVKHFKSNFNDIFFHLLKLA